MERRLAAILAADVVGYSRLMGEDEEGTLARLNACREFIDGLVNDHRGRVFGSAGDSVIAEFASPVEAVRCGVEIQQELETRNAELPEDRRMQFRIGVNLGDVMAEGENLFGDGVNIAARLEQLAEPGGIHISDDVYRQVEGKIDVAFDDLGEQRLKNVAKPVRVYSVNFRKDGTTNGSSEPPTLPDKPSIAVLPFVNISGDPEQEYFADGITEDIITALSRFRALFVMARTSSFTFKAKSVTAQDVGRELGVRYVVEGSVRRAGERVRITVQLIDATTGGHLWAERYDRDLGDIFAVQDEVTGTIVGTLAGRLSAQDLERAKRKPPESLQAYDYVLQAKALIADSKENNHHSRALYEKAIELDPACAPAYSGLANTHLIDWTSGWSGSPERSITQAFEIAKKALALDDADSTTLRRMASIQLFRKKHEEANLHLKRALSINPNDADTLAARGLLLIYLGRPEEAIDSVTEARRLNPYHPAFYLWFLGLAYYTSRQYERAIESLKEAIGRSPNFVAPHRHLAACYGQLGRIEDALAESEAIRRLDPHSTLASVMSTTAYKDRADLEHYLDGLRKAGLPE